MIYQQAVIHLFFFFFKQHFFWVSKDKKGILLLIWHSLPLLLETLFLYTMLFHVLLHKTTHIISPQKLHIVLFFLFALGADGGMQISAAACGGGDDVVSSAVPETRKELFPYSTKGKLGRNTHLLITSYIIQQSQQKKIGNLTMLTIFTNMFYISSPLHLKV